MLNIELKARVADRAALLHRIVEAGARHEWTRHMRDTFFKVPRGWLKLREAEGVPAELIAYERASDEGGPRGSSWEAMVVEDPRELERTLARVLEPDGVVVKRRELWRIGATRIHVDAVEGLGDFVELETVVTTQTRNDAVGECEALVARLRLERSDFIGVPYRDLLA